jgi:hypothetical protein
MLASASKDAVVVVWDVARGEVKARLGGPEAAGAPPAASPAAAEGGASGGKGKRRQREGCAGFAAPVRGLWWRQGGSAGGQVLACAEGSGWVQGWELGADGRAAAAAAAGGSSVGVPATAAWRTGEKSGVTRVAGVAAAAEDGASEGLVLAAATGTIAALAGADGKRAAALSALAGHALPVTALAVSSDEVRGWEGACCVKGGRRLSARLSQRPEPPSFPHLPHPPPLAPLPPPLAQHLFRGGSDAHCQRL